MEDLLIGGVALVAAVSASALGVIGYRRKTAPTPEATPAPLATLTATPLAEPHLAHVFPAEPESVADGWATYRCDCGEPQLRRV